MKQPVIEIHGNISYNTTFYKENVYVIVGEVHVLEKVVLLIEDDTVILIKNGHYPYSSCLNKSALIFDTGSSLFANNVYFVACNYLNERVPISDNGGLWFVGSSSNKDKDGINAYYSVNKSRFEAHKIYAYYLGSKDPLVQNGNGNSNEPSTDNDGITILGCGNDEWKVQNLHIEESGDNAIDLVNSYITICGIEVYYPGEDAINLQSSKLNVLENFKAIVPLTNVYDRDIFDLEIDDGPSYLRLEQYCNVEILGIFGDQLKLVSDDLPQPTEKIYYYKGITNNGQTYIHSVNSD